MYGVKTTKRSAEPQTITMFGRAAQLQARYFSASHDDVHMGCVGGGRNSTDQRLVDLHEEERPTGFSLDFTADSWNRMAERYNEIFRERGS